MFFQNLSELMKWAKMDNYVIKTGEFKDSGSPFRKMTLREREIFENLLEDTLDQFKRSIAQGRGLEIDEVDVYADGRVFTGEQALEMNLVDKIGNFREALEDLGYLTRLGPEPELFEPPTENKFFKYLFSNSKYSNNLFSQLFTKISSELFLMSSLVGRPLYLLPSFIQSE